MRQKNGKCFVDMFDLNLFIVSLLIPISFFGLIFPLKFYFEIIEQFIFAVLILTFIEHLLFTKLLKIPDSGYGGFISFGGNTWVLFLTLIFNYLLSVFHIYIILLTVNFWLRYFN